MRRFSQWIFHSVLVLSSLGSLRAMAQAPSALLLNQDGSNSRYNGIGQLRGSAACTAVFLKVAESADAPAYVLTNGHCLGFLGANEVIQNQPLLNTFVTFNYFQDTPEQRFAVNVRRVVWASMKGADLALLELSLPQSQVRERGIQPWELAEHQPQPGEPIQIVGIPVTGIPTSQAYLRRAACVMGAQANLVEFNWHFFDMWFNDCADIKGGSSGSPVLSEARQQIIAVINTTTAGSPPYGDCYLGRPCEISPYESSVREATNYAVPVTSLRECFDDSGRFVLTRAGCSLDQGKQLRVTGYPLAATQPWVRNNLTGALRRVTWNITISGEDYAYYRYKVGHEETTDCRNPADYSAALKLTDRHRFDDEIPEREGRYNFCLLGGHASEVDDTWQAPRFATQVHVEIDVTPPRLSPVYQVRELANDRWQIAPIFVVPELSGYLYKFGKFGETDCRDREGYRDYLRVPVTVNADPPQTFCLIGLDNALNQTGPRELYLEKGRWHEIIRAHPPRRLNTSSWPNRN